MHLTDAMIDVKTGNPIVRGEIALGLGDNPPVNLPTHTHLLLDFNRVGFRALVFRAVTQMKRLGNGFYDVTLAESDILIRPLDRDSFGAFNGQENQTRVRDFDSGWLSHNHQTLCNIMQFELTRELQPGGMTFFLDGTFSMKDAFRTHVGDGFTIHGIVPWETLQLFHMRAGFRRHAFVPEPPERVWTPLGSLENREPFDLSDLKIGISMNKPLAAGHQQLRGWGGGAEHIVTVRFEGGLSLGNADRAEQGADGFCVVMNREALRFCSAPITLRWIEELLRERDAAAADLSGDGIGQVFYETGSMLEPGLYEVVGIDAERVEFATNLSKRGLRLTINATLKEFGERATGISTSTPERVAWTQFSASATLPWSWLLIIGSRLIERRSAFIDL